MTQMASVGNAWIGAIGVVAGVTVTAVAGFVVAILNRRWSAEDRAIDRAEVWHERRREAYIRYMIAIEGLTLRVTLTAHGDRTFRETYGKAGGVERMEALRIAAPEVFDEFTNADHHAQMVAGEAVRLEIRETGRRLDDYLRAVVDTPDDLEDDEAALEAYRKVTAQLREKMIDELSEQRHRSIAAAGGAYRVYGRGCERVG